MSNDIFFHAKRRNFYEIINVTIFYENNDDSIQKERSLTNQRG